MEPGWSCLTLVRTGICYNLSPLEYSLLVRNTGQERSRGFRSVLPNSCDKVCRLLSEVASLVLLLVVPAVTLSNSLQDLLVGGI